jgi:hypothetical protein
MISKFKKYLDGLRSYLEAKYQNDWLINQPILFAKNLIPQVLTVLCMYVFVLLIIIINIFLVTQSNGELNLTNLIIRFGSISLYFFWVILFLLVASIVQKKSIGTLGVPLLFNSDILYKTNIYDFNQNQNFFMLLYLLIIKFFQYFIIFILAVYTSTFHNTLNPELNAIFISVVCLSFFFASSYYLTLTGVILILNYVINKIGKYIAGFIGLLVLHTVAYEFIKDYYGELYEINTTNYIQAMRPIEMYFESFFMCMGIIFTPFLFIIIKLHYFILFLGYFLGLPLLKKWILNNLNKPTNLPSSQAKIHFKNITLDPAAMQKQKK